MTYIFIGEDEVSKKIKLEAIKKDNLSAGFDNFNFQIVFAKELDLVDLEEYLHKYPFKEKKIILVIKEIENLSQDSKKFLLDYIKKPADQILLILDIYQFDTRDQFINSLVNDKQVKVFNFKRSFYPSVFSLGRLINQKKPQEALTMLNELILQKTHAQKIIGGLRYQWEKEALDIKEKTKRFDLLIETDANIKTGRASEAIALEILLVKLCS